MQLWAVMRCANKDTLALAEKAREKGAEVFAPFQVAKVRVPRTHRYTIKHYPILGSFLFTPIQDLGVAKLALERDAKEMLINGRVVSIRQPEMDAMVSEITKRMDAASRSKNNRKAKPEQVTSEPSFTPVIGQWVTVNSGVFNQYRAKVVGVGKDGVDIEFESFFGKACFSAFLLSPYEG